MNTPRVVAASEVAARQLGPMSAEECEHWREAYLRSTSSDTAAKSIEANIAVKEARKHGAFFKLSAFAANVAYLREQSQASPRDCAKHLKAADGSISAALKSLRRAGT